MDRRSFVKNACLGGAGFYFDGLAIGAQSDSAAPQVPHINVRSLSQAQPSPLGMPGLFPGRVVELSNPEAIVRNRVSQPLIKEMLERGMKELTGDNSAQAAWAKFVAPKDIVGIKINPSGAPACCSSPEIVREIVAGVQSVGVPAGNIIVYDRYAYEIDIGSYQALVPANVKVVGVQDAFTGTAGYDMEIYCDASFFGEWETRSCMASIVAHGVTKIVNVPTMKDHSAAGVTGCLKNLGYGTFNNVARSHRAP
jgi:uncharacterized protein (DUF362 family)